MLSFNDLLKIPTAEQIKKTLLQGCASLGLDVDSWAEGGITRTLIALQARLLAWLAPVISEAAKLASLDECEGDLLTAKAWDMYRVERVAPVRAKAANGVLLTNAGGGLYVFDAGDLVFAHTTTRATYRNTSGGTLTPGGSLTLDLEAEDAGSGSNALVGEITTLVTTFLGVSCTNVVPMLGLDGERDEALRERCRLKLGTLGNGIVEDAIRYWLLSAERADGTSYGVTKVLVRPIVGDGSVDVFIAIATGDVPGGDIIKLQNIIDMHATPYTSIINLWSAVAYPVDAVCTVLVDTDMTDAEVKNAVLASIAKHLDTIPIGGVSGYGMDQGWLLWRSLEGAIQKATSGIVQARLVNETDVQLASNVVPISITTAGSITVVRP